MKKKLPIDKEALRAELWRELARREYASYCQYVNRGWILGKHLAVLCGEIERLVTGRTAHDILIVSMPPQHGKSMCITETLPSWYLGKWPEHRVIEASYGDDLARRFGRANKRKLDEHGTALWGVKLDPSSRSDTDFGIEGHAGSMISRGIMGGITGSPGDLIIIDDPIKNRQEADSQTYRDRLWEEWLNSINTRRSARCKIILIQTRWHEDDLAGRLIATIPEHIKVINFPCEAEENDLLGRAPGDALFPEIGKDNAWLADFKRSYMTEEGSRAWNALFQGRPTAAEGNLIKRDWWQYYTELPKLRYKIITVDATFKDADNSDFVVIQAWGKAGPSIYMVDQIRARMSFTETIRAIQSFTAKHSDRNGIYIEDKANGSAIIDVLRRTISGILPINPKDSKEVRAQSIIPLIESGSVYLPQYGAFTQGFVDECAAFPNGTHDDQVDGMSMALSILKRYVDNPAIITPNRQHQFIIQDGGSQSIW